MRHSAAYYESRVGPTYPPSQYQHQLYPPLASLSHPPVAHVNPPARSVLPTSRTEPNRVQSSVSSGISNSSSSSDDKKYMQTIPYQYSPRAERGLMDEFPARQSYHSSHMGNGIHRNGPGRSEMVEDNSTIFRYIQEDPIEEDQENDHALWILVSPPLFCLTHGLCRHTDVGLVLDVRSRPRPLSI